MNTAKITDNQPLRIAVEFICCYIFHLLTLSKLMFNKSPDTAGELSSIMSLFCTASCPSATTCQKICKSVLNCYPNK